MVVMVNGHHTHFVPKHVEVKQRHAAEVVTAPLRSIKEMIVLDPQKRLHPVTLTLAQVNIYYILH